MTAFPCEDYYNHLNEKIRYKYAEDRIIADFKAYIDKTYGQH